jgi:hypothetical protein
MGAIKSLDLRVYKPMKGSDVLFGPSFITTNFWRVENPTPAKFVQIDVGYSVAKLIELENRYSHRLVELDAFMVANQSAGNAINLLPSYTANSGFNVPMWYKLGFENQAVEALRQVWSVPGVDRWPSVVLGMLYRLVSSSTRPSDRINVKCRVMAMGYISPNPSDWIYAFSGTNVPLAAIDGNQDFVFGSILEYSTGESSYAGSGLEQTGFCFFSYDEVRRAKNGNVYQNNLNCNVNFVLNSNVEKIHKGFMTIAQFRNLGTLSAAEFGAALSTMNSWLSALDAQRSIEGSEVLYTSHFMIDMFGSNADIIFDVDPVNNGTESWDEFIVNVIEGDVFTDSNILTTSSIADSFQRWLGGGGNNNEIKNPSAPDGVR